MTMLTRTKSNPREERVEKAREQVERIQRQTKELRKQLAEHRRAIEAQRAEWKKYRDRGGHVDFGFFPSPADATARGYRQNRLAGELRGAERALRLAQERLAEAERMAKPLSRAAQERLEELARAAVADAELAERLGTHPSEISTDGLLAFANVHGIEVGR